MGTVIVISCVSGEVKLASSSTRVTSRYVKPKPASPFSATSPSVTRQMSVPPAETM